MRGGGGEDWAKGHRKVGGGGVLKTGARGHRKVEVEKLGQEGTGW